MSSSSDTPTATVVVPAFNAGPQITSLFEALAAQTRLPDEVVVVDDGSTDGTPNIIRDLSLAHSDLNITLLEQTNQGPAVARNRGSEIARGEILLFIDSDCVPASDWLEQMLLPFHDPQVVGVQGIYRTRQSSLVARFCQLEIEERYERMARNPRIDFIGTYSAAYRLTVFRDFGGFDTGFQMASGEDADFSFRLAAQGMLMVFQPKAIVYHQHPASLTRYLRQKYWRAYWRNLIYRKSPGKAWRDTYTPTSLKLQTLLGMLLPVSPLGTLIGPGWEWLPAGLAVLLIISLVPFTIWAFQRDCRLAPWVPILVLLRTVVLALGALHGALWGLWWQSNTTTDT